MNNFEPEGYELWFLQDSEGEHIDFRLLLKIFDEGPSAVEGYFEFLQPTFELVCCLSDLRVEI